MTQRVIVVGGGIAGLAAANRLRELAPDLEIVILERAERLGGKIHTASFAGAPVETGAENFLLHDRGGESAALDLVRRVGLAEHLVHPTGAPAGLAIDGQLRPMPAGTLMGIPADPNDVKDVATTSGRDTDDGRPLLMPGEDVAVGALVRARLGDEVVDRLVDPLLGGVYAGRADDLSLRATIAGLHDAAQSQHTLEQAVRVAMRAAPRPTGAPVFASLHGGLTRLVTAVAQAARARVAYGQTVMGLSSTAVGWRLKIGPAGRGHDLHADAVVLAVPAAPSARLLSTVDADAAASVGELPYASMALVTLAFPPDTVLPELSGFLVPADQGWTVKAATFMTTKWSHLGSVGSVDVIVRASVGRYGQAQVLQHSDPGLVALVRDELPRLIGAPLPLAREERVTRWGGGLPQYGVGHVERVAAARDQLPPSLALAGAAFDGVGIAACVRSGEAAAERVVAALRG